jgi:hypothetical protein
MAQRAAQRVVLASVVDGLEEFGDYETGGGLFDVFAIGPPTVIVDLLDGGIWTREEGDVGAQPVPGARVRDVIGNFFLEGAIEVLDVMAKGAAIEKRWRLFPLCFGDGACRES